MPGRVSQTPSPPGGPWSSPSSPNPTPGVLPFTQAGCRLGRRGKRWAHPWVLSPGSRTGACDLHGLLQAHAPKLSSAVGPERMFSASLPGMSPPRAVSVGDTLSAMKIHSGAKCLSYSPHFGSVFTSWAQAKVVISISHAFLTVTLAILHNISIFICITGWHAFSHTRSSFYCLVSTCYLLCQRPDKGS